MGVMKASHVCVGVPATTLEELFAFLSEKAVELGIADDAEAVRAAYFKREDEGSTGMVNGFAIPHAKSPAINAPAIIVAKLTGQIMGWASLDGEPIEIAISLLVPNCDANTAHIRLLSKTAVMLMDPGFRELLKGSDDAEEIAARINAELEKDE